MIKHRTPEWFKARIGKFTASSFSDLMSKPADKTAKISKSAYNCIEKAATQLYFNKYYEKPDSDSTRWGMRYEKKAIESFAERTNLMAEEAGFVLHPNFPDVGATPDAIVKDNLYGSEMIIAQIKCPFNSKIHHDYSVKIHSSASLKKSKSEYYWQMQGEMWVVGAIHSYFISFDPRLISYNNLHIVKIERDDEDILILEKRIIECIDIRNDILEEFRTGKKRPRSLDSFW